MSYSHGFEYEHGYPIAARAVASERAEFMRRTYGHLAGAVLAFVAIEAALQTVPQMEQAMKGLFSGGTSLLILLLLFIGASWIADMWARSATSRPLQYAGLALYVVVEAVIMWPLLYIANNAPAFRDQHLIPIAGIMTLCMFGGLTAAVFITGRDFSFLGPILTIAGFLLLGLIVAAMIFGFSLGMAFSFAVIALACGYILYDTSNVLYHYRTDQYVAAALALFASVALLFYYILRILMQASSRR